ncbi:hypothetical protein HMSSN139_63620 [Paenibacillus sp. HMSSN-139]|nr:hypothetical protein HMSSN139_63620 [Paenibacillus sp. HMSSN-139]
MAMGADEAVRIATEAIDTDEYGISRLLAAFLQTLNYDLILGGNFSVDNGAGQVAVRIAKLLALPHVSSITGLAVNGGPSHRRAGCRRRRRDAGADAARRHDGATGLK